MKNRLVRRILLLVALLITSMVSFVSCSGCSKKSATVAMVPEDAAIVVHCDMGSIWEKGDLDHLDNYSFMKLIKQELKDEDPDIAKIMNSLLEDPNSCGLDLKGDIVGFVSESTKSTMCFGIQVKSSSKIKDFLKDIDKKMDLDIDITKESKYNLAYSKHVGAALCWDKNKAYVFSAYSSKEADKYADRLMSLEKKESMSENDDFKAFMEDKHDIGIFVNGESVAHAAKAFKDVQLPKQLNNSSLCVSMSFEKGEIKMQAKVLGLDEQAKRFFSVDFNNELVNYLPKETKAAATLAFNMNIAMRMLEKAGADLSERNRSGYTLRDLLKCLSGNFAVNLSDLNLNQYGDPQATVSVVAELSNKRTMTQILDAMGEEGIDHNGDTYSIRYSDFSIKINDKVLMISNDQSALNAFSKGGNGNGIKKVASEAKDGNYMYFDLDINNYPSSVRKYFDKVLVALLGGYLDQAEAKMTSENSAEITISLQNKDKNSLLFTLEYIDDNLSRLERLF